MVSASDDGTVCVWDPHKGMCTGVFQGDGSAVKQVAWLAGERQVIAGQARLLSILDTNLQAVRSNEDGMAYRVTCIAAFERTIATGHSDGRVWLWAINQGMLNGRQHVLTHASKVIRVLWSMDGRFLASLGTDPVIRVFEQDNSSEHVISLGLGLLLNDIAWLADSTLAAIAKDGALHLWRQVMPESDARWEKHSLLVWTDEKLAVQCLAVESNARMAVLHGTQRLVVSSGPELRIWDLLQPAREPMGLAGGHKHTITALTCSPDGRFLSSTDDNQKTIVWSTTTWKRLWKEASCSGEKQVLWVRMSAKKQYFLIGTAEDIRIFDVSGEPTWRLLCQKMVSGIDQLSSSAEYIYFVNKKRIDVMDFMVWISTDTKAHPFVMRLGHGTCVRGLDIRGASDLDDASTRFIKNEGALVTEEPSKSNVKIATEVLLNMVGRYSPAVVSNRLGLSAPEARRVTLPPPDELNPLQSTRSLFALRRGGSLFVRRLEEGSNHSLLLKKSNGIGEMKMG